jgi:hypothetical protein
MAVAIAVSEELMPETKARPDSPAQRVPRPTYRHWFALAAAAAVFALMPLGFLPPTYAVPVIGLVLAFGAAPDHVPAARPLGGAVQAFCAVR